MTLNPRLLLLDSINTVFQLTPLKHLQKIVSLACKLLAIRFKDFLVNYKINNHLTVNNTTQLLAQRCLAKKMVKKYIQAKLLCRTIKICCRFHIFSLFNKPYFYKPLFNKSIFLLDFYEVYLLFAFLCNLQRAVICTTYCCQVQINTSILLTSTCHDLLETDAGKAA